MRDPNVLSPVEGCRYSVIDNNGDGSPCIVARWPIGKREIVATMTNTDYGHEHAEYICEKMNAQYEEAMRARAAR